jgi:hypothetical protein
MTVAELINKLSKYDNDLEINTIGDDGRFEHIEEIYIADLLNKIIMVTGHDRNRKY